MTEINHTKQRGSAWKPSLVSHMHGVYLSVLVTCYAHRGNIVYSNHVREDSWINTQDRVLRGEPEPEPFKVLSSG